MVMQREMATAIQGTELLSTFAARISGDGMLSHDPRYDAARRVLDFTVDRRPLAIVRAANAKDVAEAVRFARANDLQLTVRSGGHSVAHHSVIEDAILVDLSAMK